MYLVVAFPADCNNISLAVRREDRQRQLGIFLHAENVMRDLCRTISVLALADLTLLLLFEHSVGDPPKFLRLIEWRKVALFDQPFQPIQILLSHLCSKKNAAGFRGGRLNILL